MQSRVRFFTQLALVTLVGITGHLGGSLTHGEDFLFGEASAEKSETAVIPQRVLDNPGQAMVFADIIQPILAQKCYNCHSSKKQKGQLRLDTREALQQGGKHGVVISHGNPNESELIKRILLPVEDEDHMPPRERDQLTMTEAEVIRVWIEEGAPFDKKLEELKSTRAFEELIQTYSADKTIDVPSSEIAEADVDAIEKLRAAGITVVPVGESSHYLMVSFAVNRKVSAGDVESIKKIASNITELDMGGCELLPALVSEMHRMNELRKLFLQRSSVKDPDLIEVASLKNLALINLTTTAISDKGLLSLAKMKGLKKIFLFQSAVTSNGVEELKKVLRRYSPMPRSIQVITNCPY